MNEENLNDIVEDVKEEKKLITHRTVVGLKNTKSKTAKEIKELDEKERIKETLNKYLTTIENVKILLKYKNKDSVFENTNNQEGMLTKFKGINMEV